jgi:hypothetical protein
MSCIMHYVLTSLGWLILKTLCHFTECHPASMYGRHCVISRNASVFPRLFWSKYLEGIMPPRHRMLASLFNCVVYLRRDILKALCHFVECQYFLNCVGLFRFTYRVGIMSFRRMPILFKLLNVRQYWTNIDQISAKCDQKSVKCCPNQATFWPNQVK